MNVILLKDSIIYLLTRYIAGLISLLTVSTLSHTLTTSDYGSYSIIISLSSSFSAIAFSWIGISYARLYNEKTDHFIKQATFKLHLKASILIILLFFLFFIIANLIFEKKIHFIIFVNIAILAILWGYHTTSLQLANSKFDKTTYTKLNISRLILSLIFGFPFSILGVEWCLFGISIGVVLSISLFSKNTEYIIKNSTTNESKKYEAHILNFGLPLIASITAIALIDNADKLIITEYLGLDTLAYYAAAYSITQQATGMVLSTFYIASYPRIINALNARNIPDIKKISSFLFISLISSSVLIYIVFFYLSEKISYIFFPVNIALEVSKFMPWISLSIAIGCIKSYFFDIPLLIAKETKTYTYIIIAISTINVMGNLILIPQFGLFGAIYAHILSSSAGLIITALISINLIRRRIK